MIWDISCEFAFIFSISKNDKNLNRHFTFVKCHIHMVNNAYSLVHLLVAYALIIFCLNNSDSVLTGKLISLAKQINQI